MQSTFDLLKKANAAFRSKNYQDALQYYLLIKTDSAELKNTILFNLSLIEKRLGQYIVPTMFDNGDFSQESTIYPDSTVQMRSTSIDKLIFVAKRQDGLGERLRAIVNAIAMAKRYGGKFKFYWDDVKCNQPDQAIDKVGNIFSSKFIEQHYVSQEDVNHAEPVEYFFDGFNEGLYFCNQAVPRRLFSHEEYARFQVELKNAFKKIDFVKSIKEVFEVANNVKLNNYTVALHLRAGDIIYGNQKQCLAWTKKAIPFPVGLKLIEEIVDSGKEVLVFGQDIDLIDFLAKKENVSSPFSIMPDGFGRVEMAFFDIALMARCCSIYAGTSGFALLSALISNIEFIRHDSWYSEKQIINMIISQLKEVDLSERVSVEQKSYACKVAYCFGRGDLENNEHESLFLLGKKNDPEDVFFDFIEFWYYFKNGEVRKAKIVAEYILFDKKKSFEEFVRRNVYGSSAFLKLFDLNLLENSSGKMGPIADISNILAVIKQRHQ